jgi:GAF domain-containing protein
MSATPDSTLANPEQLIADLQRQLAEREAELGECRAERDEALQREAATTEVLQVINGSPGDLAPVFDAMVERAMRLCDAAQGSLFTFSDGALCQVAATHATPQFVVLRRQQGPIRPRPGTAFFPLLAGERVVHIADLRQTQAYRDFPEIRERVDTSNGRSFVAVALRKNEALSGVLSVFRHEVRPFTDKQIALLQNFAAQAVIAMENARLLTETQEALEQQTATADVLQVINSSPGNLAPVFDAVLDKALDLCGATFGHLLTWDGEYLTRAAARGASPDEALLQRYKPIPGSAGDRLLNGD